MTSMDDVRELIFGFDKLVAAFGKWPSFHDAEVVSLQLVRDEGKKFTGAVLTVTLHLFNIDVAAADPKRNNTLTTLRFFHVNRLELSGFDHQNAISDLAISKSHSNDLNQDILTVSFLPGTGLRCSFECDRMEVESIEPFTPKWGAYA